MRSFLFLQGVATPFFARLARGLSDQGHAVFKVNFCGGDRLYWNGLPRLDFGGNLDQFEPTLRQLFEVHRFTDVILFGEQRPLHQIGTRVAREHGATVHVYEEGYVRPNWVTLERDGVNANSGLNRDPDWYRRMRSAFPRAGDGVAIGSVFWRRAGYDILYRLANALFLFRFPRYRTHRPCNALFEYMGWLRRYAIFPMRSRKAGRVTTDIIDRKRQFYLVPLQLDSDAQVRVHSPYNSVIEFLEQVIGSFARDADPNSLLVVKNHPLDTSLVNYRRETQRLARRRGVEGRVVFIDGGHLPTLLDYCRGVVTINSTLGLQALLHGTPVICMGESIYDMEGLTFQGGLKAFWHESDRPDKHLFSTFRDAVIALTQLNGSFYSDAGMDLLVKNSLKRLFAREAEPEVPEIPSPAVYAASALLQRPEFPN